LTGQVRAGRMNHQNNRMRLSFSDPVQTKADGPPVMAPQTFMAEDSENPMTK